MLTSAVLFALLAGASAATWTICLKLGSTKVNAALGAMVITGVASGSSPTSAGCG